MSETPGTYQTQTVLNAEPFDAGKLIGAASVDAATQVLLRDLAAENDALRKSNAQLRAELEAMRQQRDALADAQRGHAAG
jgi:hypothetical protein